MPPMFCMDLSGVRAEPDLWLQQYEQNMAQVRALQSDAVVHTCDPSRRIRSLKSSLATQEL